MKKLIQSTLSYCFAFKLIVSLLLGITALNAGAQCTSGCSSTVSNNSTAITIYTGQVVCLTYNGTFTQTINFYGGTLCVSPNTTVSSSITVNSGSTLYVYGKITGSVTQNGGNIFVYTGGNFSPSSMAFNGGSFTNNAGGNVNFGYGISVSSSVTLTSNGTFTAAGLINNGAVISLSDTTIINGSLVNNNGGGALSITGPNASISGSFTANGGTTNFAGGVNIAGSVANYAAINVSGALKIGGSYTGNGSVTASAAGCNSFSVAGSFTVYNGSSFNGGSYGLNISPSPGCTSCLSGTTNTPPASQPTALSLSQSGSVINGSFTSPSSSISGYIVLRYIGTSASTDNPVTGTYYSVGSAVGSSTVAAIITNTSAGTKTFADNLPSSGTCGKNAYYRIFAYNGSSSCAVYNTSLPLSGNIALTGATATISASGATTFCTPGSVTLTASSNTSYLWSTGAITAAVTATTSGTYTVTVTNASGCTATASQTVTANTVSAITPYMIPGTYSWQNTSTATVCAGSFIEFGPQPTTGTWSWTGPSGFHSYQRDTAISSISAAQSGNYIATYIDGNGCSNTQTFRVTVNSVTAAVNSPTVCQGTTATLTATGGSTYVWNTNATTPSISTTNAGTYTVTVTGANTCTATVSGLVTVNALPTPSIAVAAACSGSSSVLTVSGGNTYLWNTGATAAAITANSIANYTVTATNAANCSASASASSIIYANPSLSLTTNTPVCVGSTINLTATATGSSSYSYNWSGVSSFTANTASASVANATTSNSGSYSLTVTDNHNCSVTSTATVFVNPNCVDSTTVGVNGGGSSDAPCTQILRFDHYNDAVASQPGGQNHTWVLQNGNILTMTITRTAGGFNSVAAPSWSGAAFGQSGYSGLSGKTVLYTNGAGYAKLAFTNIQMKDSLGNIIPNFTLIGIDGESTDNSERDTLTSNGSTWFDYDTITPPNVGSVPLETGAGTNMLIWAGTGPVNARSRLVSTNNPTNFTFSTVAGGLQGFAMGVSNPVLAPTNLTICSKSSFNATPTNLPAGTTYVWSAPVVTPAGSLTGATAQTTGVSIVGQTLVNTTSSPATAVYSIIPSNNCSGLGYTVTVTVNPAPSATVTSNAPLCAGSTLNVTATAVTGSPLTYSWSGPSSFTSTSSSFTIANAATTKSGVYALTITGSNNCKSTIYDTISIVNCLTVNGNIFDDANGNGKLDTNETKTNYSQTLYSVIADTNGLVIATSNIASDGSFSIANILPSTSGMTLRVSTTNPNTGAPVPTSSWPANWLGTLGSYGTNNAAGTGVYNNINELIPVRTGTLNITGILIGFDRLQAPSTQAYSIQKPALNSIKALNASAGLGNITWADPEDGANKGSFVVTSITAMHNNVLFYDSNNNNIAESSEIITGRRVISNFNDQLLKAKFTAIGTSSISFSFGYIDNAGKTNPNSSTYTVSWTGGALPVKLISFDANVNAENSVDIKWATATEINNAYFEVERSADALDFTSIAKVAGAGNSNTIINYHTVDNAPLQGISYYRLKQVDVDGNYTYSDIVSVLITGSILNQTSVKVYPTLITTPFVNVDASSSENPVAVSVFDISGRLILSQTVAANSLTKVDLSTINQAGVYIIHCNSGSASISTKVVYNIR